MSPVTFNLTTQTVSWQVWWRTLDTSKTNYCLACVLLNTTIFTRWRTQLRYPIKHGTRTSLWCAPLQTRQGYWLTPSVFTCSHTILSSSTCFLMIHCHCWESTIFHMKLAKSFWWFLIALQNPALGAQMEAKAGFPTWDCGNSIFNRLAGLDLAQVKYMWWQQNKIEILLEFSSEHFIIQTLIESHIPQNKDYHYWPMKIWSRTFIGTPTSYDGHDLSLPLASSMGYIILHLGVS